MSDVAHCGINMVRAEFYIAWCVFALVLHCSPLLAAKIAKISKVAEELKCNTNCTLYKVIIPIHFVVTTIVIKNYKNSSSRATRKRPQKIVTMLRIRVQIYKEIK